MLVFDFACFLPRIIVLIDVLFLVLLVELLMFPQVFRRNCRSPLPNVKKLKVLAEGYDEDGVRDALLWLAPSAETISIELEPG